MLDNERRIQDPEIRVTLLGTGVPTPVMSRMGPSTLVEAGGEALLFDVGRGALQRLFQLQSPLKTLRQVFLTHLHSDHIVGLPDFWLTGWLVGRPDTPLRVYGPRGTQKMMEYLDLAFQFDIRIRLYDDQSTPAGVVVLAQDLTEGLVYEHNGVRVLAFWVDHSPIDPALGYRIEYAGRSVVISGDTRFSEHLISMAQGCDVLVHEVIVDHLLRAASPRPSDIMERVIAHHTTPPQAAEIFKRVHPRLAVFSHIIPVTATARDILPPTRQTYDGPLEIGEDLMTIDIGAELTVRRASQ
jgi:ribonuclease Z